MTNTNKNDKKRLYINIVVFILSAVILSGAFTNILLNEYRQDRERCHYIAANQIENIITVVDSVMARTYTLRAMVRDREGDTAFFDKMSREIYESIKDETGVALKNVAIAPGGIVEKVYPYEGNEGLIGFNFMDPERPGNEEAIEAYISNKTILTNPFPLTQGGVGVAGRAPVFLGDDNNELWGLVTVTMDYDNLMETLNLGTLEKMGFAYNVGYVDDDGSIIAMQSGGKLGKNPVVTTFNIRNLVWEISVMPLEGWVHKYQIILGIIIITLMSLLISLCVNGFLKIRATNERLRFLSYRDGLTGAYSRHYVNTVLVDMQDGKWTNPELKYSLIIIDIDNFKHFNDNYGHDVGDRVIYMVARSLMDNIKEHCGDCVIRFGGDEFIVLLNDVTRERFKAIARDILDSIRNIRFEDIPDLRVTISGGGAYYEDCQKNTYQEINKLADDKLYTAKEKGKNQIEI